MSELKPCPFCGGSDLDSVCYDAREWNVCRDCGADGPVASTQAERHTLWNTRPSDNTEKLVEAWKHARPLIEAIAAYEAQHGTVAWIAEEEREAFCSAIMAAAIACSARAALSALLSEESRG
jgi:Lar family restriction alleviation protein